jgi:PAS domain S-box-containing protein
MPSESPAVDSAPGSDHASRRFALLVSAGELLSSSLDYGRTLQHVARLAVPALGDLCIVDVLEDGRLRRMATAHVCPRKAALLEELARRYPTVEGSPAPAARALASGRTEWFEAVTPELVASHTVDAEHARLILEVGMRSHIAVPMVARGSIVGIISLGITESERRYAPDDVVLAEELAQRAALAIDHARLYQQAQREIAQRSRVEADLRRSERRFRLMMEQSPLSMQLLAIDGRTLGVNRAWETLWGATLADVADYDLLADPQLEAAGITPLLRRAFAGEAVSLPAIAYDPDRALPGRSRDGTAQRWVRAFAYPVRDDAGAVEEVVLVHEDVTDAKRAEEHLRASEERLNRALAIGRMNVWDWDLASDTVECSANALDFWGMQVGQAADFLQVIHPDDIGLVEAAARATLEDDADYQIEYRLRSPDGSVRWVQSRGHVEGAADGRPTRLLGVTLDITERRRAGEATRMLADAGQTLGASLDYQTTLRDLAHVVLPRLADWYAIDLLAPDGTLERVSVSHPDPARVELAKELHRRYPPRRDAPLGPWHVIGNGQPDWAEHITDGQLEGVAQDAEHLALLRSLNLRSYIRVPLQARGVTIGVMTFVYADSGRRYDAEDVELAMDLARRAAVAVDNARLYRQLQLADQRKDEFLAMLAHELRNPLAPISTAAELLRRSAGGDPRVLETSGIITRQVAHMTELVDDLLDVSRVTRGLVELEKQRVDLESIAAAAIEQVHALVESRGHALDVRIDPVPLIVEGDRARLIQVLANLLNNAVKYTPPGGAIDLAVEAIGDRIRITVRDTGIGIDRALLPHVFDLFTQAQRTPDRSQGGLGIGLALVRSIVRLHGGDVHADSAGPDRGSVFTVTLPRAASSGPVHEDAPARAARSTGPKRVLIVDDNVDAATTLADVLRVEGHDPRVASSAAEALELVAQDAGVDICILDIGLPDMTGYALAARLRERIDARPLRFIALTGYGQARDRAQSAAAGFDHHLVKPADLRQLLGLLGEGG